MKTLGLLLAFIGALSAQEVLTNDSISKMVKAGLGESVIITMIQSQPGKYSLSADDLVKLRRDGVSDKVLAAIVSKGSAAASPGPEVPVPPPANEPPAAAPPANPERTPPAAAAPGVQTADLKGVRKIFVDKLPNDLDQYLRAEFFKQMKGKVLVVIDEKDADAILTGVSEEEKGTGAKITGRYLGLHDLATGTLSLLSKDRKAILWSDEAGDRSLVFGAMRRGGERKVAERLIGKLKKAMGF